MGNKQVLALSPLNAAMLGIMDELYDLYCTICCIYEHQRDKFKEENMNRPLWGKYWDELCIKEVRSAFLPVLQTQILHFTNSVEQVNAPAYAFQAFSFVRTGTRVLEVEENGNVAIGLISFSDFLFEYQRVISNLHFRWRNNLDNNVSYGSAWQEVNNTIEANAKGKLEERLSIQETDEEITGYILYVFDHLSGTRCHKENHKIIPTKFIACFASGNGKIALPAHYCEKCKKYFIGKKTLALFESSFGKLLVEKRNMDAEESNFDKFKLESKLHQLGYNVIDGKMNHLEREKLLIYLVEHELISYFDLCSTLENNIRFFQGSGRHQLAVAKWKSDLKAIGEYIAKKKRIQNTAQQ